MARPTEDAMRRRRMARLILIILFAIVTMPIVWLMMLAGARADRR